MSSVGHEIVRAAAKASWSRFVTLLSFALFIAGLRAVRDWLGLGILLVGVATFVFLAFSVEVLSRRFFGMKK